MRFSVCKVSGAITPPAHRAIAASTAFKQRLLHLRCIPALSKGCSFAIVLQAISELSWYFSTHFKHSQMCFFLPFVNSAVVYFMRIFLYLISSHLIFLTSVICIKCTLSVFFWCVCVSCSFCVLLREMMKTGVERMLSRMSTIDLAPVPWPIIFYSDDFEYLLFKWI